jgi:hypothetical protein
LEPSRKAGGRVERQSVAGGQSAQSLVLGTRVDWHASRATGRRQAGRNNGIQPGRAAWKADRQVDKTANRYSAGQSRMAGRQTFF